MTGHDDLDRTLTGWFEAEALSPAPAGGLDRVLDATRRRRPRPAWLADPGSHWIGEAPTGGSSVHARLRPLLGLRWSTALVLLLVLMALVSGAILVGARLFQPSPRPISSVSHLAYGLNGDIYVADRDGANPVRIANGAPASTPAGCTGFWGEGSMWSPDGRHLAYRSGWLDGCPGTVYISDPAGQVQASFPGTGWLVSWSPDSTRVATWITQPQTIGIYGLNGVRQAMLALPAGYAPPGDFDPVWSPDGRSLHIRLAPISPSDVNTLLGPTEVWELPLDGGTPRPVPADDPRSHLAVYSDDGSRVAFTTTLPTVTGGVGVDFFSLVVAQADGTPIRTLIGGQNRSNGPIDGDVYQEPLWSPSGDQVAFIASNGAYYDREGNPASRTYELQALNVASGTVTSLASATSIASTLEPIRFSPGGDRILVSEYDANGAGSLWSVPTDGSGARLLVPGTAWGDWQPVP